MGFTPAWAPAAIMADMSGRGGFIREEPIKHEAGAANCLDTQWLKNRVPRRWPTLSKITDSLL